MDIQSRLAAGSAGRITGNATGLDVDKVIKDMLKREIVKVEDKYRESSMLKLKQQAFREVIKKVKEFQKYFDQSSEKYISSKDFNVSKLTNSDESIAGVTADSSSESGEYKIKVSQLAKAAQITGKSIGGVYKLDSRTMGKSIKVLNDSGVEVGKINIDSSNRVVLDNSLKDKVKIVQYNKDSERYIKIEPINNSKVKIDDGGVKELLDLNETTKLSEMGISNGIKNFTINGVSFNINVTDKTNLQDLKNGIEEKTDKKVTVEIDKDLNIMKFKTTGSGTDKEMVMTSTITNEIGMSGVSGVGGSNSKVVVTRPDGLSREIIEGDNNVEGFGLKINLKKVDASKEIIITIDKKSEIDKTVNKIKGFVDDYNKLIGLIQGKLTEKKDRSFKPLSESEKKSMKSEELEKWNKKVKGGILRGDPKLRKMLSSLRGVFSGEIYKTYDASNPESNKIQGRVASYGKNTFGMDMFSDYKRSGQLNLNIDKLKEVIEKTPEMIEEIFTKASSTVLPKGGSYIGSNKYKEDGILSRIDKVLKDYVGMPGIGMEGKSFFKGILNIAVNKQNDYSISGGSSRNTIPDQIHIRTMRMKELEKNLFKKQEMLYLRFSKLEKAMNKLNAQSNYMMKQLG